MIPKDLHKMCKNFSVYHRRWKQRKKKKQQFECNLRFFIGKTEKQMKTSIKSLVCWLAINVMQDNGIKLENQQKINKTTTTKKKKTKNKAFKLKTENDLKKTTATTNQLFLPPNFKRKLLLVTFGNVYEECLSVWLSVSAVLFLHSKKEIRKKLYMFSYGSWSYENQSKNKFEFKNQRRKPTLSAAPLLAFNKKKNFAINRALLAI